jgi:hypothetical protein
LPNHARLRGGWGMRLWWLSFKGGRTVIVRAETLVHARLLAAADEVARAYLFDDGSHRANTIAQRSHQPAEVAKG